MRLTARVFSPTPGRGRFGGGWSRRGGEVGRWSVEPFESDWSVWGPEGQPMRAIPTEGLKPRYRPDGSEWRRMEIAYRPPYHRAMRADCYVPDAPEPLG